MRLEKAAMVRVIHDEPAFSEMFIAHLLARTIRVEEDLVDQLFNSSEKRLARTLLLLANFGKEGRPEPVIAKVSQETLAEMVGTTRSRVSQFMNKFRKLGLIDYNGQIVVHNSLLSVVLNDNPHLKTRTEPSAGRGSSRQPSIGPLRCRSGQFYTNSGRRWQAGYCLTSDIIDLGQHGVATFVQCLFFRVRTADTGQSGRAGHAACFSQRSHSFGCSR